MNTAAPLRIFDDDARKSAMLNAAERRAAQLGISIDEAWEDIQDELADDVERASLLFDPEQARFGRFLECEPPERRMLLRHLLPLDMAGLVAGMGGSGKSILMLQLHMSVASGLPWVGHDVDEVGASLGMFAEDDEGELHRRSRAIFDHYNTIGHVDTGAVSERMHIVTRVGEDNLLTAGREGEAARTELVDRIIEVARRIDDLKLITIDPVSRFRGGRANDETDTTAFVVALEQIQRQTGATVLATVHVNKSSIREGAADQSIVRGSTALVDGVRWVATMTRMPAEDAPDYGVDPDDAGRFVRLDLVKANYVRPWAGMWLERTRHGVLAPAALERSQDARREQRQAERYEQVIARIHALIRDIGPLTASELERKYAGVDGPLGVGKHAVRGIIQRALGTDLIETADVIKGGAKLTVPNG